MKRLFATFLIVALVGAGGFVWTGVETSWRRPEAAVVPHAPNEPGATLRTIAYNVAKANFHRGGFDFASRETVEARLDEIAAHLAAENPDVVFLSEVVRGDGPSPVDQVAYLANALNMHAWVYGDNYRFGLPFYRLRAGNALLARFALVPVEVQQLAGGQPFYAPTNNRRLVWCDLVLGERTVRVGSVRNDSFDLANNARQVREILDVVGPRGALLGGDFNAEPHDESFALLRDSGRFTAVWEGPPTFPSQAPTRRIDNVLAPADWNLAEHRVLGPGPSDHRAVLSVFQLPR